MVLGSRGERVVAESGVEVGVRQGRQAEADVVGGGGGAGGAVIGDGGLVERHRRAGAWRRVSPAMLATEIGRVRLEDLPGAPDPNELAPGGRNISIAPGWPSRRRAGTPDAEGGHATEPRHIVPETAVMVTTRCVQRQFKLGPSQKVNDLFEYLLAFASTKYGVGLLGVDVQSNHAHQVLVDLDGQLPDIVQEVQDTPTERPLW